MSKAKLLLILALGGLVSASRLAPPANAKPAFMDRYNRDAYAREELRNRCTICHLGRGGGERNDFGEAFADAGYRVTPKLRARFSKLFAVAPPNGAPEENKNQP